LLGADLSLGYPAGTAAALGLAGGPHASMWALLAERIEDDERNRNNRFEVAAWMNEQISGGAAPFWGCPPSRSAPTLTPTKPPPAATSEPLHCRSTGSSRRSRGRGLDLDHGLSEWRHVEAQLRESGHRPASSWQLLGAGSVGSQSLTGVPVLERLRRLLPERFEVWPFTTGLDVPEVRTGSVVVCEVWPSLWPIEIGHGRIRDEVQVESTARRLADLDSRGELAAAFCPAVATEIRACIESEEGWVLGVPADASTWRGRSG
jgi:precorrin-8X/cobalt-precorrin-8 methylmutase